MCLGRTAITDRPVVPWPCHIPESAILVVPFSDGTTSQEVMGGLAVLAFFVDRITFSATIWEVPWHVRVRIRPLDALASPPMQICHLGAQEQDLKHP